MYIVERCADNSINHVLSLRDLMNISKDEVYSVYNEDLRPIASSRPKNCIDVFNFKLDFPRNSHIDKPMVCCVNERSGNPILTCSVNNHQFRFGHKNVLFPTKFDYSHD